MHFLMGKAVRPIGHIQQNNFVFFTERSGSLVTHETRIREVPGSNPGADQPDCGFPQSTRQMLGWIFITTIHLTIIHKIDKS